MIWCAQLAQARWTRYDPSFIANVTTDVCIGTHLHARLTKAQVMYAQQAQVHDEFTALVPPNHIKKWLLEVETWEKNPSLKSPYYNAVTCTPLALTLTDTDNSDPDKSVNDVKDTLEEAERQSARATPPIHETSATACLMLGLLIEDMQ